MNLPQQLEAILFWKAEPVSLKKLAALLNTDVNAVKVGLQELENDLKDRGLTLIRTDDEVMLGTR
jgi:chromosome segregation and condensation protein ScpB